MLAASEPTAGCSGRRSLSAAAGRKRWNSSVLLMRGPIAGVIALALQGCVSMYVYPEGDVDANAVSRSRLSSIVVGIEPNPADFDYGMPGPPQDPYDLGTLIEALAEHHVFKEVGYLTDLKGTPNLVLGSYRHARPVQSLHGEDGGPLCIGYYGPISLLTLTILPVYCDFTEDVTFVATRPDGQSLGTLGFTRYAKSLLGVWAPVAVVLNPDWHMSGLRPDSDSSKEADAVLRRRYKAHIVKAVLELEPQILRLMEHAK